MGKGGKAQMERKLLKTISTRVPLEVVQQIEKFAELLNKERPGLRIERGVAVRVLLTKALDAMREGKWS